MRDLRDIIAGSVLMLLGGGGAIQAATSYSLGTFNYMGPGMFPLGVSILLGMFGIALLASGLRRHAPLPAVDLRAAVAVLASIATFAVTTPSFGLLPAATAAVFVSTLADGRLGIFRALLLAALLAAAAWLIFIVGLRISVPAFRWPF